MFEGPLRLMLWTFLRALDWIARWLFWRLRIAWAQLTSRAKLATTITVMLLVSAVTSPGASSVAAATGAVALIAVVAAGIWLTLIRVSRRRW